ncbi:hypothetical protein AAHA92_02455 [Salvia divinorum]|uniref:Transmembrane protein n=1 Tax=Salvia divinorum TaxID=28513 RepID=A0ABD1IES6_SALDI
MDQNHKDADYYIIDQTTNQTNNFYLKKTLQFLVPISIISFLVSYFSVFSIILHSLQFYSSIFPSLSERKCMFFLCNGILAFLAKNLNLNTSARDNFNVEDCLFYGEYDHNSSDAAAVPEEKEVKVQDSRVSQNAAEEIETEMVCEEWNEDEDDEESEGVEESPSVVSDMRVSTEELNKKFDEFIRRMKEEIRIEARQQYLIVV